MVSVLGYIFDGYGLRKCFVDLTDEEYMELCDGEALFSILGEISEDAGEDTGCCGKRDRKRTGKCVCHGAKREAGRRRKKREKTPEQR